MSDQKVDDLVKGMQKLKEKLSKDPVAAKAFLQQAGILTEKGNYTRAYKNLCIPPAQG